MDKSTQRAKIIAFCKQYGSITVRDAFTKLNINSPTKRISEIRYDGTHTVRDIEESCIDEDGSKVRWKRYFISEGVANEQIS